MLDVTTDEAKKILERLTEFAVDALNGGTFLGMDITEEELDDGSTIMSFTTDGEEFRVIIRSVQNIMENMTVVCTAHPAFALSLPPPTFLLREDEN